MRANAAERILATIDWSRLHASAGDGEGVGGGLRELLAASAPELARQAYWKIENHAFAQGELFEVAEAWMSVLIASLADPRESWVRVAVLELMFQMLGGYAGAATPSDMLERCQRVAREGLWLLFRESIAGEREAALDVLEQLGEADRRSEEHTSELQSLAYLVCRLLLA